MSYTIHIDYFDPRLGNQSCVFYEDTKDHAAETAMRWLDGFLGNGEVRQGGSTVLQFDNAGVREPLRDPFRRLPRNR
jgi:hypothetical protein